MGTVTMYTPKDLERVTEKMAGIVRQAQLETLSKVEPSGKERADVLERIRAFIKRKKRVVYGGTALNALVKRIDPADAIYADDPSSEDYEKSKDIEFFSPYVAEDVQELCDEFDAAGYPFVEAKMALHDNTYAISVNLVRYCDVTFMPQIAFRALPVVQIDGLAYVHPHFAVIDYFRVLNDPLNSFFRLDKDFKRLYVLQKHFPFQRPANKPADQIDAVAPLGRPRPADADALAARVLAEWLHERQTAVCVGYVAYAYFMDLAGLLEDTRAGLRQVEVITTDFAADAKSLYEFLRAAAAPDRVQYREHLRFYDFWSNRGVFTLDGYDLFVLHDYNHRCVPFLGPVKIDAAAAPNSTASLGTFTVCVMMLLMQHFWHATRKNAAAQAACMNMVCDLYEARNRYLAAKGATLLDDTPFKELVIPCVGKPMSVMRARMLRVKNRMRRGQVVMLKYAPRQRDKIDPAQVKFDNLTGDVVKNPKLMLFVPPQQTPQQPPGPPPPQPPPPPPRPRPRPSASG